MNMLIYHVFITCLSYARLVTIVFLWGELLYFTPASLIKVSVNWHPLHQCFVGCSWVCMYIQLCSRVLMGMSHSETLLHGSNEHQSLPVKGVIMELHGEQRWAGGAETGVMSERVLALLMEPQSALLLAKASTGCYGSKHLPFYFSFCLNKKVMWWHHSAVLLLHSIARVHWDIYLYIYIYTHTHIYVYIYT